MDLEAEWARILDLANRFDMLPSAGFEEVLTTLKDKVDAEITEATLCPMEPQRQQLHVIRWNAMREILDAAINHVDEVKRQRDDIRKQQLERDAALGRGLEDVLNHG